MTNFFIYIEIYGTLISQYIMYFKFVSNGKKFSEMYMYIVFI